MSRELVGLQTSAAFSTVVPAPVGSATNVGQLLAVEPLVTKKIIAAVASTSLRTVDRMVAEGRIPVIYIGPRSPRFRVSDVLRALGKLTVKEVS